MGEVNGEAMNKRDALIEALEHFAVAAREDAGTIRLMSGYVADAIEEIVGRTERTEPPSAKGAVHTAGASAPYGSSKELRCPKCGASMTPRYYLGGKYVGRTYKVPTGTYICWNCAPRNDQDEPE
jgi:hypothetical protein